jgi:4-diphosphocytidyl-2-C-methyl-D-erythritol kinase
MLNYHEVNRMPTVKVTSSAKLNLLLAITGKRKDGYHNLMSLVSQVSVVDEISVDETPNEFSLSCNLKEVPVDQSNLILKAAALFKQLTGYTGGAHFVLKKEIPLGAGLGGGSSNAVAAMRALEVLTGKKIDVTRLQQSIALLGSDCPLFLSQKACLMRGRGEQIEVLPDIVQARIKGRKVVIYKPDFGIATAWAYKRMSELTDAYLPSDKAEARVKAWIDNPEAPLEDILYNNMQRPAFLKFPSLAVVAESLYNDYGLKVLMSGSGSACFALLPPKEGPSETELCHTIKGLLGDSAFVRFAVLVG